MARESREVWAKRVERWKDSGLTAAEFAAEVGVNPRTLTYWKWHLRASARRDERHAQPAPARADFVEVVAPMVAVEAPEPLEIVLADGLRIRVPVRFDETSLRRVVATLGAR
jgi:hypothetical protein